MNYKPYPAYKDSGVEWLGEIPEGWNIRKLGLSSDLIVPMRDKPEQLDGDIPWIRIEDFDGRIISESKSQQGVSQDTIDKMNLKIIPKGSVLCTCSCSMGTVAIVGAPLVTNQTFIGIYPKSYVTEFLAYLMECSREELSRIATGAIQTYLSRNDFSNLRLPLPPLSTQKAIAAFLDARTARIDGLVQDYEELVSLLKEKRQTLVSHAVTRGLSEVVSLDDPDFGEWARPVAFKDSGIEWLGEIPEEWEAKKLKYVLSDIKAGPFGSALTKDMYVPTGIRVYGQEQVIPGDFSVGDYYISESLFSDLKQYEVFRDDILVSCVGTFGKIALFPENAERGIINPRLIRLRTNLNINPLFLTTFLKSNITFNQFDFFSRGGTMDVINIGTLSELFISFPHIQEQKAITAFLDRETAKLDALVAEAEGAIELLKERRSALITAAITGKISVEGVDVAQP